MTPWAFATHGIARDATAAIPAKPRTSRLFIFALPFCIAEHCFFLWIETMHVFTLCVNVNFLGAGQKGAAENAESRETLDIAGAATIAS
jgi:hypothetical protein